MKRQTIAHSYGDVEDEDDFIDLNSCVSMLRKSLQVGKVATDVAVLCTNEAHKDCPFNKANLPSALPVVSEDVDLTAGGNGCNRCGSLTHKRSTHRDCPFNKRYSDIDKLSP